ncbi:hypothetical protein EV666_11620 [Camelimonas lactis]|uniref:DUF2065 domain-containing protein n=1 Tax=Camelimonas lactis TaxID=659006 RepID=A0A4R2GMD4_9HYPH|nr:hypothetical protein EV666_11620 [Camelimonas lactis]
MCAPATLQMRRRGRAVTDLVVALGLLLAIEGLLLACAPEFSRRMAAEILAAPGERLRLTGVVAAVVGVAIIWLCLG